MPERRMPRLIGGHDAEFGETRQIVGMQHFDMFDPVARIVRAVHLPRGLIAIERAAHGKVADRMDRDLEAPAVGLIQARSNCSGKRQRRPYDPNPG